MILRILVVIVVTIALLVNFDTFRENADENLFFRINYIFIFIMIPIFYTLVAVKIISFFRKQKRN